MMTPLQKAIVVNTGFRIPGDTPPARLVQTAERINDFFDSPVKHRLELKLEAEFFTSTSNKDQYEFYLRQALKHMSHDLYSDVLDRLVKIQRGLYQHKSRFAVAGEIEKLMEDLTAVDPNEIISK